MFDSSRNEICVYFGTEGVHWKKCHYLPRMSSESICTITWWFPSSIKVHDRSWLYFWFWKIMYSNFLEFIWHGMRWIGECGPKLLSEEKKPKQFRFALPKVSQCNMMLWNLNLFYQWYIEQMSAHYSTF